MSDSIRILTSDNLSLDGRFSEGSKGKPAVFYIHGMFGNFHTPKFVVTLEQELPKKDFAFLATNNQGTEGGSKYELLEEAHIDITAGITFLLDKGYSQVILIGHSSGTVKVVRYLFEGELKYKVNKLILLSPIDPLGYRIAKGRNDIDGFLKQAQAKVDEGKGEELITPEFDHDILSYRTFISWYKRDNLGRMFEFCSPEYDFPILKQINIPTLIITGSKDEYLHPTNPEHSEEAMEIMLKNISNSVGKIIENANHNFNGNENELVKEIVNSV